MAKKTPSQRYAMRPIVNVLKEAEWLKSSATLVWEEHLWWKYNSNLKLHQSHHISKAYHWYKYTKTNFTHEWSSEMLDSTASVAKNQLTLPVVGVDDELSESRFRDWISLMLWLWLTSTVSVRHRHQQHHQHQYQHQQQAGWDLTAVST